MIFLIGLFNGKLCSMCKMIVGWEIGQVALMDLRNGKTCSIFQIIVDNQRYNPSVRFNWNTLLSYLVYRIRKEGVPIETNTWVLSLLVIWKIEQNFPLPKATATWPISHPTIILQIEPSSHWKAPSINIISKLILKLISQSPHLAPTLIKSVNFALQNEPKISKIEGGHVG